MGINNSPTRGINRTYTRAPPNQPSFTLRSFEVIQTSFTPGQSYYFETGLAFTFIWNNTKRTEIFKPRLTLNYCLGRLQITKLRMSRSSSTYYTSMECAIVIVLLSLVTYASSKSLSQLSNDNMSQLHSLQKRNAWWTK